MIKQVALIPSGNQIWYRRILCLNEKWLVYCSSLSLYVFDMKDFLLRGILTGHSRSITCADFSFQNGDVICSCSTDQTIRIWNVKERKILKIIRTTLGTSDFRPICCSFQFSDEFGIICGGQNGELRLYNYQTRAFRTINVKPEKDILCVKFHPKNAYRAVCCVDGGIIVVFDPMVEKKKDFSYKILKKYKRPKVNFVDIQFDPLSEKFFIALTNDGDVALMDMEANDSLFEPLSFIRANAHCVNWIPQQPGNFLTGDKRSGTLKKWNISSQTPEEVLKIKERSFSSMMFIPSFSKRVTDSIKKESLLLGCCFEDGCVGVYNTKHKSFEFCTEPGHTETIFGCCFSKTNPNLFATSSYDSMIKLWDIAEMKCVGDLFAQNEDEKVKIVRKDQSDSSNLIIYSVDWHPTKDFIAGSLASGWVWIWDVSTLYPLHKFRIHSAPCYKVFWNPNDPKLIATASKDKSVVVFDIETGKPIKTYRHPHVVFGVDWSPHSRNILATGCFDNIVRIYNITTSSVTPLKKLSGHSAQVYNVRWNPLVDGVLASGSNDFNVHVWNTETGECKKLVGHTHNVRALEWNPETPYLLLSGSWDGSIRVWDIRGKGNCVHIISDHHADVYGLSVHPKRPFIYGSTSRDSTIRFWTLQSILQNIYTSSCIECSLESSKTHIDDPQKILNQIFNGETKKEENKTNEEVGEQQQQQQRLLKDIELMGKESESICKQMAALSIGEKYSLLLDFLFFPFGSKNLISLISKEKRFLGTTQTHFKKLIPSLQDKIIQLESEKHKERGIGDRQKEEVIKEQATLFLKMGNLRRYCECLIELGEWEKAISISPGLNDDLVYWKQLTERYTEFLLQKGDEQAISYLITIGETSKILQFFLDRKRYNEANVVAVSLIETLKRKRIREKRRKNQKNNDDDDQDEMEKGGREKEEEEVLERDDFFYLKEVSRIESEMFHRKAQPFHSSSCFFRIDDEENGIRSLIKGNEILHAFCICEILKCSEEYPEVIESMCRICYRMELYDNVIVFLNQLPNDNNSNPHTNAVKSKYLCLLNENDHFSSSSSSSISELYMKCGLQSPNFYSEEGKRLESKNINESIQMHALGRNFDRAAFIAFDVLSKLFDRKKEEWDWEEIEQVMHSIFCIDMKSVEKKEIKHVVLGGVSFYAAQKAIWKGYYKIAPFLVMNAKVLFSSCDNFLISKDYLDFFTCLANYYARPEHAMKYCEKLKNLMTLEGDLLEALEDLMIKIQNNKNESHPKRNQIIPTSSVLPVKEVEERMRKSFFTGDIIDDHPILNLPQGKFVSLSEALMYLDCTPFSPFNSGEFFQF